jgi:hypothetical protein
MMLYLQIRVNIHHRRMLIDRNAVNDIRPDFFFQQQQAQNRTQWFRRLLGLQPAFDYQNSTIVVQRHTIPPFSRRIMAELIDFFILFLIKMIIVYSLVEVEAMWVSLIET